MRYLTWAVVALLAYSLVAPLMKVALAHVPSDVAVFVSNLILVVAALTVATLSEEPIRPYLDPTHPGTLFMLAAGCCLAVGILAYYRALELGDVSVVVPIFGLFIVFSSLVGVVALDEPMTARKALGIAFAVVALILVAGE